MKHPLILKFLAIGLVMLLLLIPIVKIGSSIDERKTYSETVVKDIARSSSYSQTLVGPVLAVPYKKTVRTWIQKSITEKLMEESLIEGTLYFLPDVYRVDGEMTTDLRKLGIYVARLYHANTELSGHFTVPEHFGITEDLADYQFATPFIAIGISDTRGIENALALSLNGKIFSMEPNTKLKILGDGVHVNLAQLTQEKQQLDFSLQLKLQGTEKLNIAPVGKETQVTLHSDWPHPKFTGDFLPVKHTIDNTGFKANWQTSYFSTNFAEYFYSCANTFDCKQFHQRQFGVSLIDPVNHYVKSDRAIKYALLFIALTFASFFLFEVLKRLQVHPVQYGLVGLALAFFYLLLLSLAEHIGFAQAYVISSVACVLLIGMYVSHVLQSWLRATGFTLGLSLLYALLYVLLSAEDYSLLMGSVLLFVLLGIFMMLTRKVNWYALGDAAVVRK